MARYYLFLSVPVGIDRDKLGLELCILHNAFDFLSKDKRYYAVLGYEYSGKTLVQVHLDVTGINLEEFIDRKQNRFITENYPRFRLWTLAKGYILSADETDWENHKYLENGCRDVFTWKGEGYRAQDEEIKSVYEKYKDKKPELRPKPKTRRIPKYWKSNIVVESKVETKDMD